MIALILAAVLVAPRVPAPATFPAVTAPRVRSVRLDLARKRRPVPLKPKPVYVWRTATASVYDEPQGTAWGEWYSGRASDWLMVAHKTLPHGTRLRLRYRGRECDVTVEDRGPYIPGRELDLSWAAKEALGFPYGVDELEWRTR